MFVFKNISTYPYDKSLCAGEITLFQYMIIKVYGGAIQLNLEVSSFYNL